MKSALICFILLQLSVKIFAQHTAISPDIQIKLALLAAPEDKRDSATVFGYTTGHQLVMLKKGTNPFICLADDPAEEDFSVACYQKDLEPFMHRGRELRMQGKKGEEIFKIREQEVQSAKLKMPTQPTTLFVYSASSADYDSTAGEVKNGYIRSVIYIPYATAESTGLPLKPSAPGLPWIMNPGTHGAHIMINPPVLKDAVKK